MTQTKEFGSGLWKWLLGATGTMATLVGAIFWLSAVQTTAISALEISKENKAKIEALQTEQGNIRVTLTEIRGDIRLILNKLEK